MVNIVDWLLLAVAIVGIYFTYVQIRHNAQTSRASFLAEMHNRIINDREIMNVFQKIDWGHFEYFPETFPGSEEEIGLDRLLVSLDLMCMFYYQGKLKKQDIETFEYLINRLNSSNGVREYFSVLEGNILKFDVQRHPFQNFLRYSKDKFGGEALPGS